MKHGLRFEGVAVAGIGMVRFGMFRDIPGRTWRAMPDCWRCTTPA